MKKFLFNILISVLAVFAVQASAQAQERNVEHQLVIDVHFMLSGGEESDINKKLTTEKLQNALRELDLLNADTTALITSVEFYSSVSPEGSREYNEKLGEKRLKTAERIIRRRLYIPEEAIISYDNQLIPWDQILVPAIKADKDVPYRDELLQLFERKPSTVGQGRRREKLYDEKNRKLYEIVEERYFELMRRGGAVITVRRSVYDDVIMRLDIFGDEVSAPSAEALTSTSIFDEGKVEAPKSDVAERGVCPLHIKTNALGLGLAIANIAAEIDFAKHWSFSLPVYYSEVNYFTPTIKFRTLAIQPELRYWIKENNTGFFAGAHFGLGYYNIATNGELRYQDHDGKSPALGGGISVGYRVPISKNQKWNIDFSIGAGCYKLHYDTFYNVNNGRLVNTYRKTYWGLDNAAVNISYRFDFNKRKK